MKRFEMCRCGHFGGSSPNSVHDDRYQNGHGKCNDCDCEQFTWTCFCDEHGRELESWEIKEMIPKWKKEMEQ